MKSISSPARAWSITFESPRQWQGLCMCRCFVLFCSVLVPAAHLGPGPAPLAPCPARSLAACVHGYVTRLFSTYTARAARTVLELQAFLFGVLLLLPASLT
jgi:hypothetical protein